jgi:hypothetical protein
MRMAAPGTPLTLQRPRESNCPDKKGRSLDNRQHTRSALDPADDLANFVGETGMVLLKDSIPLRTIVSLSANAVDYYLWRKMPSVVGSILCMGQDAKVGAEVNVNYDLLRAVCLGRIGDIAREYFQRRRGVTTFCVPLNALKVRPFTSEPRPGDSLPYHQDTYGLPPYIGMLNAWTLLYPDKTGNDEAAGLELIPANLSEAIGKQANGNHPRMAWIESDYDRVRDLADRHGRWVPSIELGDVMLFNQYALHRTEHDTPKQKPRLAVELRMIAWEPKFAKAYTANNQPIILVENGEIIGPTRARITDKEVQFLS